MAIQERNFSNGSSSLTGEKFIKWINQSTFNYSGKVKNESGESTGKLNILGKYK